MPEITLYNGEVVFRQGKVGTGQGCCCESACECPVTVSNCTVTITYTGGNPARNPETVPLVLDENCQFEGAATTACEHDGAPREIGIWRTATITCESCCRVADGEGRLPGDDGYVPTFAGKNCTISDSALTTDCPGFCANCGDLPTDVTLTLNCTEECGNAFP